MSARTKTTADLAYLCRALKAPSLLDAAARLAERARADAWSHEEYLAACLEREVAARQSHGGEARVRAARLPARKALSRLQAELVRLGRYPLLVIDEVGCAPRGAISPGGQRGPPPAAATAGRSWGQPDS